MAKDKKLWIDMCAGSELKDTQGETLSVQGADISDLENGNGRLNDNHGKGFFNSLGRVTEAKKIFKSEDCDNERHKYFWEKIKAPFIYAKGYLYSDEDHPNAKAAAAILRNIHREDAPLAMKASVEGGVIARGVTDSSKLARTKIHSVALTFTPANNATLVEPLNVDKSASNWDADMQLIKSVMHLAETNVPSFRHIQRHASANAIYDNIKKIQELAKGLGIDIEVKSPSPETIIQNAVLSKVQSNVLKINKLVKQIRVNQLGMLSTPSKLSQSPNTPDSFPHPELVTRWQGKGSIPEGHPDRQPMANYINDLKNTPHPQKLNTNVSEARRLYDTHMSEFTKGEGSKAAKGVALAIGLAHGAHYINQAPAQVKEHAQNVHSELESQKKKTVKEHNSRVSSNDIKLSTKEYGFDEKKPAISNIEIKNKLKKAFEKELDKSLTAGYGGAGMPTDMVGGGVIQSQSLESKRKKKVKNSFKKALLYNYYEVLEKGKKELLQMYKPEHKEVGKEHINWVTKTLPTPLHNWAVINHRDDPQSLTPEIQQTLTHFGGMQHAKDIADVRMDRSDNFQSGINKLNAAQDVHNNKQQSENKRWLKPKSNQVEKIKGQEGRSWYDLNTSYDHSQRDGIHSGVRGEGDAMNHCGNINGDERTSDNLLSLREKDVRDGIEMHKPHATFITNNGWLGEMKGHSNQKPSSKYHKDIVQLLKHPDLKGIAGGGYDSDNNFEFNDLSEEHKKEVLSSNPNLITDIESTENKLKALNSNSIPEHHASAAMNTLDPKYHEQLIESGSSNVKSALARSHNLNPKCYEQLVNDKDAGVRAALARNGRLNPKCYEQLVNDKDAGVRLALAQSHKAHDEHHEQLVNDEDARVRHEFIRMNTVHPKYHEQLLNDKDPGVRRMILLEEGLDPKYHEQLVNDKDVDVRRGMARHVDIDPKYHEQLVNDKNVEVRRAMACRSNLNQKHKNKLINDDDDDVRANMAKYGIGSDKGFHEQLVNDKSSKIREYMAHRQDLDPKYHEQLVNDKSSEIRLIMAIEEGLDPKLHEQLVNDKDVDVRRGMASRRGLDPKYHEQLANDEDHSVRITMAERYDLDPKYHERLVNDKSSEIRLTMAGRRDLDLKYHEQLANDEDDEVRDMINFNTGQGKALQKHDATLLKKSIEYITCDNCGHEQVHMPHQVKCRECKHNFSLYRLNNLK